MDVRIMVVGAAVILCGFAVRTLASSWQRARTIDVGGVSTAWLVEQRVDRNPEAY
jgi:hypothetical protein